MQLRACLGILLLATGACAHIPEVVRLEVDGNTVEIKKRPGPVEESGDSDDQPDAPPENDRGK